MILDGIELVYNTFGEPSAAPMLLVAGLGMQMIDWDIDTADAIPGPKLMIIRGMGHGLPPPV